LLVNLYNRSFLTFERFCVQIKKACKLISMTTQKVLLTSRKASQLLHVHESSIKRWCNSKELVSTSTEGGHRRIDLSCLLTFAKTKNINHSLEVFDNYSREVFLFREAYLKSKNYKICLDLIEHWMKHHQYHLIKPLLFYCNKDISAPFWEICDQLIFPSLETVGNWWMLEEIGIADEHRISQEWIEALSHLRLSHNSPIESSSRGVAIIACSQDNTHDIASLCLRIILEDLQVKVIYLGAGVPTQEVIRMQTQHEADLVCLSFSPVDDEQVVANHLCELAEANVQNTTFALAIGGQPFKSLKNKFKHHFEHLGCFSQIEHFQKWLEKIFPNSPSHST
jgi:methanogenic corrinoid protein MtbC1